MLHLSPGMRLEPAAHPRLSILEEMTGAAQLAGEVDLVAEAALLRAAALIEHGDPDGLIELARYTRLADRLGHARGRWGALSRRATLVELTGRVEEAVAYSAAALELGEAIGLPDAMGVFATLRGSLAAIGGPRAPLVELMPAADPLWPIYPLLQAWGQVQAGDLEGCAAYHGVVDHYVGILAAALGRTADALSHLGVAVALHERLGTVAWAELSRAELDRLRAPAEPGDDTFRLVDGM